MKTTEELRKIEINRIVKAWCEDYNNKMTMDTDRVEWYDISTIITRSQSDNMKKMVFRFRCPHTYRQIEEEIDFDMYIRDLKIQDAL